jgi:hypothetical protein
VARGKNKKKPKKAPKGSPSINRGAPWDIIYFEKADGSCPALNFLDGCPPKVEAMLTAVLDAVAAAPPPQFSGGGKWEAMHGDMGGYYEVRTDGPSREHFRLFCVLENGTDAELVECGLNGPTIAVITGMRKSFRTTFGSTDYAEVRRLGDEHKSNIPRRFAK